MNRRSFLGTIGAVAAALVAAPKVLEALEPAGDQTVPITITDRFDTNSPTVPRRVQFSSMLERSRWGP